MFDRRKDTGRESVGEMGVKLARWTCLRNACLYTLWTLYTSIKCGTPVSAAHVTFGYDAKKGFAQRIDLGLGAQFGTQRPGYIADKGELNLN